MGIAVIHITGFLKRRRIVVDRFGKPAPPLSKEATVIELR
jgi:hypothetical protein